jgi:predicted GH43/DUF377 family glycosyl hydrolase
MNRYAVDQLVFGPAEVDLSRSPLAKSMARAGVETCVLGAFNPGMTRLPNGNLLLMVRVAEALREPIHDGHVHSIRWDAEQGYALDAWPLELADTADPRQFKLHGGGWKIHALTSLTWLLPVELTPEGLEVVAVHYDRAVQPQGSHQCYGVEDARISKVGERYLMTTCTVSPERHATSLYTSDDGLDWAFQGLVLDHQNKDMLIFQGLIGGQFWAQTRPLGDHYFAYPPQSDWRAGPSINLATSPDSIHWRPHLAPGIRPHTGTVATWRMGGGAPPILTEVAGKRGWLSLWHGVEPNGIVGTYRTYWSLLDPDDPAIALATSDVPLLEPDPELTHPLEDLMYVRDVVFTTGIVETEDHFVVGSGEADLACRITHVPRSAFD